MKLAEVLGLVEDPIIARRLRLLLDRLLSRGITAEMLEDDYETVTELTTTLLLYQLRSEKNAANGYLGIGTSALTPNAVPRAGSSGEAVDSAVSDNGTTVSSSRPLSCPGVGTNSERFGAGTGADDNYSVVVGNGAMAVGGSADQAVAIGYSAAVTGQASIAIGRSAYVEHSGSIAIGPYARVDNNYSVAIGPFASTNADHQVVFGGPYVNSAQLTDFCFGSGERDTSPQSATLHGTGGSGANKAGANLSVAGGCGTGTGAGGSFKIRVAPSGAAGSTPNSLVDSVVVDTTHVVTLTGRLHIKSGTAFYHDLGGTPGANRTIGLPDCDGTVWTSGNQGAGSGLDADTVDGSHASAFAAAVHNHAASEITSGTLVHERGGLEADVSAYGGLVKISGGATSEQAVSATPGAATVPVADGAGKLAAGWGGSASTLATLNASAKVVEDPANATATATASKIPIADGSAKLDTWVSDSSTSTKGKVQLATDSESAAGKACQSNDTRLSDSRTPTAHAATHITGSDKLQTETGKVLGRTTTGTGDIEKVPLSATAGASTVPLADASGKLSAGWGNAANSLATLDALKLVVENPASASAAHGVSKIPLTDAITERLLATEWLHAAATAKVLGRGTAGAGAVEEKDCTTAGFALLDDATAGDQRTTLGLGDAATKSVGTTAGTVAAGDDSRFVAPGYEKIEATNGDTLNVAATSTLVFVDAHLLTAGQNFNVQLPAAATLAGRKIEVKVSVVGAGTSTITVTAAAGAVESPNMDASAKTKITHASDGSDWHSV